MTDGEQVAVAVTTGPPYAPRNDSGAPLLGSRFDKALLYAASVHRRQVRKGSGVPYLSHLVGVASLVLEHHGDETAAIGALLHDCIEDCGSEHAEFLRVEFGEEALAIVEACSDASVPSGTQKPDWSARKQAYIAHLVDQPPAVLLVSACDKLHNARSILSDLRQEGLSVWDRFGRGESDQLWYYRTLADTFVSLVPNVPIGLAAELARTVAEIELLNAELAADPT
ncbi:MAG TPA: HD domain-containing protein [Acidimicrobiales bacterium]|nr:HD domain-containing protein [Acidimicrobiales bacterium]